MNDLKGWAINENLKSHITESDCFSALIIPIVFQNKA
jgi:hypothetical protein